MRLYLVATSHLDTQWRWTVQDTIREYLPRTLDENFARFEKYPGYVLSFEGAFRYQLIEEYYPKLFERLKEYVTAGRWFPAGSMLDAPDVNIASSESLIRHLLYGSRFFERKLGANGIDIFLPDCFGFSWSLPSIAAHCGLKGFSSSKLVRWMKTAEKPFDVGVWEGPDGARILCAIHPDGYGERLEEDPSRSREWIDRIRRSGEASRSGDSPWRLRPDLPQLDGFGSRAPARPSGRVAAAYPRHRVLELPGSDETLESQVRTTRGCHGAGGCPRLLVGRLRVSDEDSSPSLVRVPVAPDA
jgi:hypothetical protein